LLSQPGEVVSLQRIEPGGFLLSHNDPERVSIMQCLTGCSSAWVRVEDKTLQFEKPGAIIAFDNIEDHSTGCDVTEDRWVINVVIAHPGIEVHNEELDPRPQLTQPAPGFVPLPELVAHGEPICEGWKSNETIEFDRDRALRGRLGGPDSEALEALHRAASGFDCTAGERTYPRNTPEVTASAVLLQHNTNLLMPEYDWEKETVLLRIREFRTTLSAPIPHESATIAREACQRLKDLGEMDPRKALQSMESNEGISPLEALAGKEVPLQIWMPKDETANTDKVATLTSRAALWHVNRLRFQALAAVTDSGRQEQGASQNLWKRKVTDRLALLLEHLMYLQLVNAYQEVVKTNPDVSMLRPLPEVVYHDVLADRVGVVLSVLGEAAQDTSKLFIEVGVYNGSFALGIVRHSRFQYLGFDPYSRDGGSFSSDADGQAMFHGVASMLHRVAGPGRGRVALRRSTSDEAAASIDSADFVFIDGAHQAGAVYHDLHIWWPKVRPGGILFGHDFAAGLTDVLLAISLFCHEVGCSILHLGLDTVFWLQKFLVN